MSAEDFRKQRRSTRGYNSGKEWHFVECNCETSFLENGYTERIIFDLSSGEILQGYKENDLQRVIK